MVLCFWISTLLLSPLLAGAVVACLLTPWAVAEAPSLHLVLDMTIHHFALNVDPRITRDKKSISVSDIPCEPLRHMIDASFYGLIGTMVCINVVGTISFVAAVVMCCKRSGGVAADTIQQSSAWWSRLCSVCVGATCMGFLTVCATEYIAFMLNFGEVFYGDDKSIITDPSGLACYAMTPLSDLGFLKYLFELVDTDLSIKLHTGFGCAVGGAVGAAVLLVAHIHHCSSIRSAAARANYYTSLNNPSAIQQTFIVAVPSPSSATPHAESEYSLQEGPQPYHPDIYGKV